MFFTIILGGGQSRDCYLPIVDEETRAEMHTITLQVCWQRQCSNPGGLACIRCSFTQPSPRHVNKWAPSRGSRRPAQCRHEADIQYPVKQKNDNHMLLTRRYVKGARRRLKFLLTATIWAADQFQRKCVSWQENEEKRSVLGLEEPAL